MDSLGSKLKQALTFLYVTELRSLAAQLELSEKGGKMLLILRIVHFFETGEKLMMPKFPKQVCAARGKTYPLNPTEKMLKGAYKNDLKTRLFFKQLIGEYFHFTAYGIDWLNQCWLLGTAPTYQDFADMWVLEYQKRKNNPVAPKEEWAYINFVQQWLKTHPQSSRAVIHIAWETARQQQKTYVLQVLGL